MLTALLALVGAVVACGGPAHPDNVIAPAPGPQAAAPRALTPQDVAEDPPPPPAPDVPTPPKGMYIGSWKPDAELGFDKAWVDEEGVREAYTKWRSSRRAWAGFTTGSDTLPMDQLVDDREGPAIAYMFTLLARRPPDGVFEDQQAVLHVRHKGRMQARLDGELIIDAPAPPDGTWGDAWGRVVLTDPYDVLLIKVGRGSEELGASMDLQVRVSAPDGSALPDQSWNTMRPPGLPSDLDPPSLDPPDADDPASEEPASDTDG